MSKPWTPSCVILCALLSVVVLSGQIWDLGFGPSNFGPGNSTVESRVQGLSWDVWTAKAEIFASTLSLDSLHKYAVSYSLNSLKGIIKGLYWEYYRGYWGLGFRMSNNSCSHVNPRVEHTRHTSSEESSTIS